MLKKSTEQERRKEDDVAEETESTHKAASFVLSSSFEAPSLAPQQSFLDRRISARRSSARDVRY